ncbi:hypothetical protein HYY72_05660 [Candidatus Woesearchaeota archaeon]|nr:hypothetical protein [Candidatus Woesearchaeota archaeon]
MNSRIGLGGGLELVVIDSDDYRDCKNIARAVKMNEDGVPLSERFQWEAYHNLGEPNPDEFIRRANGVPGNHALAHINKFPSDYQLFLLREGRIIGMRGMEIIELDGFKRPVLLDYMPVLVPESEAGRIYEVKLQPLIGRAYANRGETELMNPVQILLSYSMFFRGDGITALFTDGDGLGADVLRENGYLRALAVAWIPGQKEPVYIHGKFFRRDYTGVEPSAAIPEEAAKQLFVDSYLLGRHVDRASLANLCIKPEDLPYVNLTIRSIRQASQLNRGFVPFMPIGSGFNWSLIR